MRLRRAIALMLGLALLSTASAETYLAHYMSGEGDSSGVLLLEADGTPLTERGLYSALWAITPRSFPESDRLYEAAANAPLRDGEAAQRSALMDARGRLLTDFDYLQFTWDAASESIIYMLPDQRVGLMRPDGTVVVSGRFTAIAPDGAGGFLALLDQPLPDDGSDVPLPLVRVDALGRVRHTGLHVSSYARSYALGQFSEGLCVLSDVTEYGGSSLYLDAEGTPQFDAAFSYADGFIGALAMARRGDADGMALINRRGERIAEAGDGYITSVASGDAGLFIICQGNVLTLYDARTGELLLSEAFEGAESVSAWENGWGSVTAAAYGPDGTLLRECLYGLDGRRLAEVSEVARFDTWYVTSSGGTQRLVVTEGEWPYTESWLTDLEGHALGSRYRSLSPALWRDGRGRLVFSTYDIVHTEAYGDSPNWRSARYGVCDENGAVLLEPRYEVVEVLDLDRYWVRLGSRCGMIDGAGNWYYTVSDYESLMD